MDKLQGISTRRERLVTHVAPISERRQMAMIKQMTGRDNSDAAKRPLRQTRNPVPYRLTKVNEKGETKLHVAARLNKSSDVTKWISEGADVNARDYAGWTPLHEACLHGSFETAKCLLTAGALVNVLGPDNETPLHDAARSGDLKLVSLLLDYGAGNDINNLKETPSDVAIDAKIRQLIFQRTNSGIKRDDATSDELVYSPTTKLPSAKVSNANDSRSTESSSSVCRSGTGVKAKVRELWSCNCKYTNGKLPVGK